MKTLLNIQSNLLKKQLKAKDKENEDDLEEAITLDRLRNEVSNIFRRAVAKEVKHETNIKELEQQRYKLERATTRNLNIPEKLIGTSVASISLALLTNIWFYSFQWIS